MADRTYKANVESIRRRLEIVELTEWDLRILKRDGDDAVGLKLIELAELIRRPGERLDSVARTIGRALKGERIERNTLVDIAAALQIEFDEVWVPDEKDKVQNLIDEMVRFDRARNYAKAQQIGLHLLGRSQQSPSKAEHGTVVVRLAMAYDHDQMWPEALDLLEEHMDDLESDAYLWARYQRGLIQRDFAEYLIVRRRGCGTGEIIDSLLEKAREDLEFVVETDSPGYRLAAKHQLAVLLMIEREFEKALAMLLRCLEQREQAPEESGDGALYRLGYEHRRIAQCHACLDNWDAARHSFEKAAELADESNHARLRREVKLDLAAWGQPHPVPTASSQQDPVDV